MLNYILKCYLSKKSFLNKIEAVQRLAPILNISATCSILIGQMPAVLTGVQLTNHSPFYPRF